MAYKSEEYSYMLQILHDGPYVAHIYGPLPLTTLFHQVKCWNVGCASGDFMLIRYSFVVNVQSAELYECPLTVSYVKAT